MRSEQLRKVKYSILATILPIFLFLTEPHTYLYNTLCKSHDFLIFCFEPGSLFQKWWLFGKIHFVILLWTRSVSVWNVTLGWNGLKSLTSCVYISRISRFSWVKWRIMNFQIKFRTYASKWNVSVNSRFHYLVGFSGKY